VGIDADGEIVLPVEDRVERQVVIVPARDEKDAHGVLRLREGAEGLLGRGPDGPQGQGDQGGACASGTG
jgi:hypothetical protein